MRQLQEGKYIKGICWRELSLATETSLPETVEIAKISIFKDDTGSEAVLSVSLFRKVLDSLNMPVSDGLTHSLTFASLEFLLIHKNHVSSKAYSQARNSI